MRMTYIPVKDVNYFKINNIKFINHCKLTDVEITSLDDFVNIISSNFYTPIKYRESGKEIKRNAKNFGNYINIDQDYIIIDIDDIYSKEDLNNLVNFLSRFRCYIVNTQSFGKEKHGKLVYPIRVFFPFSMKRRGIMMINEFICDIIENGTGHSPDRISTELGRIFAPSYDIIFKVERHGSFIDDEVYKIYPAKEIKGYEGAWINYLKEYVKNRKDINGLSKEVINTPIKINIKGRFREAIESEKIYINYKEAKEKVKYLLKNHDKYFNGTGAGSLRGFSTNIRLPWNDNHTTSTYYLPDSDTIISFSQTVANNYNEEYCKLGNNCIVFSSLSHFLAFTESIIGIDISKDYIKMMKDVYKKFKRKPKVEEDAVIKFCLKYDIEFKSDKLGGVIKKGEFLMNSKNINNLSNIYLDVSPLGSGKTYRALKDAINYDFTIFIANNQASVINIKNEAEKIYKDISDEKIMTYLDIHSEKVGEGRYYYLNDINPMIYITTMESFKNDRSLLKYREKLIKKGKKIKVVFDEFDQVISNYDLLKIFYIIKRFIMKEKNKIKVEFLTATGTDMFKRILESELGSLNIINNRNNREVDRTVIFKHDIDDIIRRNKDNHILFLCRSKRNVAKINALLKEIDISDGKIGLITGLQSINEKKENLNKQFIISTAITSGYNFTRKPDLVIIYDDNAGLNILDWMQTLGRLTRKIFDNVPIYMIPAYRFSMVKNYKKLLEIDKDDLMMYDEYIKILTNIFDSRSTILNLMEWKIKDERENCRDKYKNILDKYIKEIKEDNISEDNIVYKIFPIETEALNIKIEKMNDIIIKIDKVIEKKDKEEIIEKMRKIINSEKIDYTKQENRIILRFLNILIIFFEEILHKDEEHLKDLINRKIIFEKIDKIINEYKEKTFRKINKYSDFEDFMKSVIIYKRKIEAEDEDIEIENISDIDLKYDIDFSDFLDNDDFLSKI